MNWLHSAPATYTRKMWSAASAQLLLDPLLLWRLLWGEAGKGGVLQGSADMHALQEQKGESQEVPVCISPFVRVTANECLGLAHSRSS